LRTSVSVLYQSWHSLKNHGH